MKFSTKAKNLIILSQFNLRKSKIPKFCSFYVYEWLQKERKIIEIVKKKLNKKICVRSSFYLEDSKKSSMAGEFESYTNIKNDKTSIIKFTNNLINQYKKKSKNKLTFLKSEIIFQDYINNSILSGVVTNYCLKDGTEYYVINYDDTSNLTNTVTSGGSKSGRVLNIYKRRFDGLRSKKFKKILLSIREIEQKISKIPIDVEFALDDKGIVNLFQIRPISTSSNWKKISSKLFFQNLLINQKKFLQINNSNKKYGDKAIFGLMPDWNPVEMIGYQPGKLAYSIYEILITKDSWSKARAELGYKKVTKPLMYNFTNKPYIDSRLSFYSFIPKNVSSIVSRKLVNYWSNELNNKPYLHDKIEFEIADGSYDLDTKQKIFKNYNFLTKKEKLIYISELKKLTNSQIKNYKKNFSYLVSQLNDLENKRIETIIKFKNKKNNKKKLIKNLLLNIKKNGIVPFAKFARNAFIAKKTLNSLLEKKFLNKKNYFLILNSIESITNSYINMKKKSQKSKNDKIKFDNYFYHLRPGTYDITIKRYKEKIAERKINELEKILHIKNNKEKIFKFNNIKINKYLAREKFNFNSNILINYIATSIRLRENSKFIFTRALSDLLQLIKILPRDKRLDLIKISNLSINEILKNNSRINNSKTLKNYTKLTEKNIYNEKAKLPYLITNKDDFFIASILLTKPNFITEKKLSSDIIYINNQKKNLSITNKIVLIENADPGFDWIFSSKIKGLITKYGGVNSHMSIRCEELNIPAAIGIGDENFEKLKNCKRILLNCINNKISII